MIFEIWWNFFYDLFTIKNVADVNSIDSFVRKRNMEEFSVVIMKRFRSNWFKKTKGRHVTYNTRQSVLRRKRIYASFDLFRQRGGFLKDLFRQWWFLKDLFRQCGGLLKDLFRQCGCLSKDLLRQCGGLLKDLFRQCDCLLKDLFRQYGVFFKGFVQTMWWPFKGFTQTMRWPFKGFVQTM